jgi:hypothetical protein
LELAELYHGAGYDFLFRTDHWIASDAHSETGDCLLLWLDGIELDGVDSAGSAYHVVGLGAFQGLQRGMGLIQAMDAIRAQGGLLILAHPHWTGNTFADALRRRFDGVEIYNHVCRWLNGKGEGGPYWSVMLKEHPNTLAFAVDDAHLGPGDPAWNGGWVMVNAAECTPPAIYAALKNGNFYSTCGPTFETIALDDQIFFRCSPVRFARLVGPGPVGLRAGALDGSLLTSAAFEIPQTWPYAYLEIEDESGRRAWTNPLFISSST